MLFASDLVMAEDGVSQSEVSDITSVATSLQPIEYFSGVGGLHVLIKNDLNSYVRGTSGVYYDSDSDAGILYTQYKVGMVLSFVDENDDFVGLADVWLERKHASSTYWIGTLAVGDLPSGYLKMNKVYIMSYFETEDGVHSESITETKDTKKVIRYKRPSGSENTNLNNNYLVIDLDSNL